MIDLAPSVPNIWRITNARSLVGMLAYESAPSGKSSRAEFAREGGRCYGSFEGDLKGYGVPAPAPLTNAMSLEIAAGGVRIRKGLISAKHIHDPKERQRVARLQRAEIKRMMSVFFPHSPYIIPPSHLDTPAVHTAFAFVPMGEDGKPLDIRPAMLRAMQDFRGAVGIIPGRGTHSNGGSGGGGGRDDEEEDKAAEHAEAVRKMRLEHAEEQASALRKLQSELQKISAEELIKKRRLKLKLTAKSGRELRSPSLEFDGVRVRFDRLQMLGFPALAGRLRAVKPMQEPEDKKAEEPLKRRGLPPVQQHNMLAELAKAKAAGAAKSLARQAARKAFGPAGGVVFDVADFAARLARKRVASAQKSANANKQRNSKKDEREM